MNYIDLFAGAGGLSEGFLRAGFKPVAHVEMNKDACYTLKTRLAYYHLLQTGNIEQYYAYLRGEISRDALYKHLSDHELNSVINSAIGKETREDIFTQIDALCEADQQIDLIIGGPPCQAYSVAGRARLRHEVKNDARNFLYVQYAEFLRRYRPKMFVFENVLGLLSAKNGEHLRNIRRIVEKSGYEMSIRKLNAGDFNVLQNRRRLIIIGWRKGSGLGYPSFTTQTKQYTVSELLRDLPALQAGTEYTGEYQVAATEYLQKTGIRSAEWPLLTQHITRPHLESDITIYRAAIELWNKNQTRLQYTDLPAGLRTHSNITTFLDRFKVVAADLHLSQTVVAHINRDGHYYIHPDHEQGRSLSVREAARIQSFPDNYYFEGSRTSVLKQIGNAVPPLMAEEIAHQVRAMLTGTGKLCQEKPPKEVKAGVRLPVRKKVTSGVQTVLPLGHAAGM